jgi:uncharacterized cupredoxin-like copper-binding protein
MRAQRLSIALLAAGALAVAGCGGDDNGGGGGGESKSSSPAPSSGGGGGSNVKLSATEFKFSPSDPSVKKTGTVTFTVSNDGQVTHALEVEGKGVEQKTGDIQSGKSATLKVDLSRDGTYEFYCPIDGHKQQGMEGKVKVGSGGGSSSSSSGDDDSSSGSGGGGAGY